MSKQQGNTCRATAVLGPRPVRSGAPANRTKREQRIAKANAAAAEGRSHWPEPVTGKNPRAAWLRALAQPGGPIPATVRLVAAFLQTHGNADGSRIRPGVRLLAGECDLSQRVVCAALDQLVRRGYLLRHWRDGRTAGSGYVYVLTIPKRAESPAPRADAGSAQGADARSADRAGADAGSTPVLTLVQEVLTQTTKGADAASANHLRPSINNQCATAVGSPKPGRPRRSIRKSDPEEIERRRREAAAICDRLAADDAKAKKV